MRVTKTNSTKDNLCDYCTEEIPTCLKTNHVKFGDGKGNDNVIECSGFKCTDTGISGLGSCFNVIQTEKTDLTEGLHYDMICAIDKNTPDIDKGEIIKAFKVLNNYDLLIVLIDEYQKNHDLKEIGSLSDVCTFRKQEHKNRR